MNNFKVESVKKITDDDRILAIRIIWKDSISHVYYFDNGIVKYVTAEYDKDLYKYGLRKSLTHISGGNAKGIYIRQFELMIGSEGYRLSYNYNDLIMNILQKHIDDSYESFLAELADVAGKEFIKNHSACFDYVLEDNASVRKWISKQVVKVNVDEEGYFNYATVDFNICKEFDDAAEFCKENLKVLSKIAYDKLIGSKGFIKTKTPNNLLQISKVVIARDCTLQFVFDLKKEIRDIEKNENKEN